MQFSFLIPAAGCLAHLATAAFLFAVPRAPAYVRLLGMLSLLMAAVTAGLAGVSAAPDEESALFRFYLMRHALFFAMPVFVHFALRLSGRGDRALLILLYIFALLLAIAMNVTYWSGSRLLIEGARLYDWGYFPVAGPGARFVFVPFALLCGATGIYVLLRPRTPALGVSTLSVALLALLWWFGFVTNLLALLGLNALPLGSVSDTILTVVLAALLTQRFALRPAGRVFLFVTALLASLAVSLLVMWLLLLFVPKDSPNVSVWIAAGGILGGAAAVFAFEFWFRAAASVKTMRDDRPLFTLLQTRYGLSYQQARICELVDAGRSRPDIRASLGITDGKLRNHFSHIYELLLDETEPESRGAGDRLQRLTVFLRDLQRET